MADEPQTEAPEGMETKDAVVSGDAQITYRSAPVPNTNRTGSGILDGLDLSGGGEGSDDASPGVSTASGGSSTKPAVGKTTRAKA
ncbi:MAG: hypothetical protein H7Y15_05360 [Pseudonocardia sp.]|nr:hypothetical protein [Pseudonocardia sp.]